MSLGTTSGMGAMGRKDRQHAGGEVTMSARCPWWLTFRMPIMVELYDYDLELPKHCELSG